VRRPAALIAGLVLLAGCAAPTVPRNLEAPSPASSSSAPSSRSTTPPPVVAGIDPLDAMTWPAPDHELTPGALTPGCTYPRKASERNVTAATKRNVLAAYNITDDPNNGYDLEFDHLIPFSLCGSNGAANIWPQRYDGVKISAFVRNRKDSLESYTARRVASKNMSLETAQELYREDWRVAWCKYRKNYASAGVKCPGD